MSPKCLLNCTPGPGGRRRREGGPGGGGRGGGGPHHEGRAGVLRDHQKGRIDRKTHLGEKIYFSHLHTGVSDFEKNVL